MYNPFGENMDFSPADEELVLQAKNGGKEALESLVRRHQGWIYNVAVRMVWRRDDAQDATQDILIKMITGLPSFEGKCQFRTWLYRIAANHTINLNKKQPLESQAVSYDDFGRELDETPDLDLPDPRSVEVDVPLLVEDAKIGCMVAMLMCLDRRQRLVYILGEIFGATDRIGAELMMLTAANFRQLLTRARRDLYSFMNNKCGLINQNNPCRCAKKTRAFMERGYIDPRRPQFAEGHRARIREMAPGRVEEMDSLVDRMHGELFRDHPFLEPLDEVAMLRRAIDASGFVRFDERQAGHDQLN